MKPKIVLGICDNHDAGVALIKDGLLLNAVNEERLNRIKFYQGFPYESIRESLDLAQIRPSDVDTVMIGSTLTPAFLLKVMDRRYGRIRKSVFSMMLHLYIVYQVTARKFKPLGFLDMLLSHWLYRRRLAKMEIRPRRIEFVDHHLSHIWGTYVMGGTPDAVALSIDGMGDGLSVYCVRFRNGKIEQKLLEQTGTASIQSYYARITEYLGFKSNRHEGKITGLAAYGKEVPELMRISHALLNFDEKTGKFNRQNLFSIPSPKSGEYQKLAGYSKEDIAYNFQLNLERAVLKVIRWVSERTDCKNLQLSGGLFANVKVNQRIHATGLFDTIYISPHMGDGGLALGAALYPFGMEGFEKNAHIHVYGGRGYTQQEIKSFLDERKVQYKQDPEIEKTVARLLAEGKTVVRFDGRMEFGPRALGNRSILFQATDPLVNDWLNKKLNRTEFMPFAPVTMEEHMNLCYEGIRGAEDTSRFMNITFDCTDWFKQRCKGVVHVDGTARVQLLRKVDNPGFHKVLEEYQKLTGIPSLINTSFNMHEEPIVCNLNDAIEGFYDAQLDYLALGTFLIEKVEASSLRERKTQQY